MMNVRTKFKRLLPKIIFACMPALTSASPVKIEFVIGTASVYDYTTAKYDPAVMFSKQGSMTFDIDDLTVVNDYGFTTISQFGWSTTWDSPVTHLIPRDPFTGADGGVPMSYTFPNVSDYPSTFIEEAASQGNSYGVRNGVYSTYHIELRATIRSQARNGDGTSDYAFTRQGLLDYYRSFVLSAAPVYFNESYAIYDFVGGVPVYSEGRSWAAYSAKIISVSELSNPIPEPVSPALFAFGLVAIVFSRRWALRGQRTSEVRSASQHTKTLHS